MSQGWLGEITLRSCCSKWVNSHMEVNDRPMKSGGDGANTTKALMADDITFKVVIYRDSSFFNDLKHRWKHLLGLMFIF